MPNADDQHFDSYPPQTRVKHRILSSYLPAYLTALKNTGQQLAYVDGFAGRGTYVEGGKEYPGKVESVGLMVDPARATVRVQVAVRVPDGEPAPRPGSFVVVRFSDKK